jgi:hypothetical protein
MDLVNAISGANSLTPLISPCTYAEQVSKSQIWQTYGSTHYILVVQVFDCPNKLMALRYGICLGLFSDVVHVIPYSLGRSDLVLASS